MFSVQQMFYKEMQAVFSVFTPIVLQYYAGTRKLILYNRVIIIYLCASLFNVAAGDDFKYLYSAG